MNAIVSLCHFCELHGPSVVFCTQAFRDLPTLQENSSADKEKACKEQGRSQTQKKNLWTYGFMQPPVTSPEPSMMGGDTCLACRSIPHNKPGYISNDDVARVSYVSSQFPLQPELFTLMRQACIRSLSCEVCPGQEGPIYFGDDTRGQVIAYTFFLQDVQARGFKRMYSILVLMKDKMFLLNSWPFIVKHLKQIIGELQHKATKVYKTEESHVSHRALRSAASLTPDNFRRQRAVGQPRSFCEVVNDEMIWKFLHSWFTWVLKAGGLRLQEKVVEGPPSYTFSSTAEEHDAFTVRDLHGWLGGSAFRCLLHHLLIGHQVIIKGHDAEVVSRIVGALMPLLPKHSYQAVKFSREYQANCNVLGVHSSVIVPDVVLQLGSTCILILSPQELQVLFATNRDNLVRKQMSNQCSLHSATASPQDRDVSGAIDKKNEVLMKFKYQIMNEGPLLSRPPQVLGRIEAAIVNPAISPSTLLVFLATIMEEWINKAKVWAHVQSTSRLLSEPASSVGIPQASNSLQVPTVSSISPSTSPSSPLSPFSHRIMYSPPASPVSPAASPSSAATSFSSASHSSGTTDMHQLLAALGATEWDLPLLQFWSIGLSS